MDLTSIKVAALILKHHGVSMCIAGELALNYYNVPRVCHDLEVCITKSSFQAAAGILCSTGLFEISEPIDDFNNYTAYKRGFPRLQTTHWANPPQNIIIFPAAFFGLDPVQDVLIQHEMTFDKKFHISKEFTGPGRDDIIQLPLPRLAPLLKGLAKRFLDTRDDVAMVSVEQLVDGMNLDEAWVERNLGGSDAALLSLVLSQISSKKSRIDYFSENKITCFISDEDEAEDVRLIPGFDSAVTR